MYNIRRNKKGFTLVELIVVIAILAILAGTAAGIGVTLINKNTNKSARSEVNLLVDDFKQTVLEWETDECAFTTEEGTGSNAERLLKRLAASLNQDSKQIDKISTGSGTGLTLRTSTEEWNKASLKAVECVAGTHKFGVAFTTDEAFTVRFSCAAKGAGDELITATYTYAPSIG